MKVCILISAKGKDNSSIKSIANALAKGIEQQNHIADIIDIRLEGSKIISYYDYVIVGCEAINAFGGKIPQNVSTFLKNCGSISGKRCMAFVTKPGIRSNKTLQTLMKTMEGEGMYLKTSDVITKDTMAMAIGKRLHIEFN